MSNINFFRILNRIERQFVPFTGALSWSTTTNTEGVAGCEKAKWVISDDNLSLRYEIADAPNCLPNGDPGACDLTQIASATATITVGDTDIYMGLDFEGMGESQDAGYERIKFKLDDTEVANATSQDLNGGCVMVPVIETYIVPSPYLLSANTTHLFTIEFTTGDSAFHKDAYYQINLSFSKLII